MRVFIYFFGLIWFVTNILDANPVYEAAIKELRSSPNRTAVLNVAGHLRGVARNQSDLGANPYYFILQSELLSVPGHATYFADELERLIADPVNRTTDIRQRRWYIEETLVHLPSPETIWVLGNYLSDERYTPKPGVDNSGGTRQNSYLATTALRRIGLRESDDFIRTKGNRITIRADVDNCLRWWSEVKSGQRPFSFNGENVEYRFNGDGTWEAVALSDSTRRRPTGEGLETKRPQKRFEREDSVTSESMSARGYWMWLVVSLIFIFWVFNRWARGKNRRRSVI